MKNSKTCLQKPNILMEELAAEATFSEPKGGHGNAAAYTVLSSRKTSVWS